MVMGTCLSIITLNESELSAPTKRPRLTERIKKKKKKKPMYMLYSRDSLQTSIETEREGMEKNISCKWQTKEGWNSNTYVIKNKL